MLTPRVVRFLKEKEPYFKSRYGRNVDPKKYTFRVLVFTSCIQLTRQHVSELNMILRQIPQFHNQYGIFGFFTENIIGVYCFIKHGFKMDKENVPPCLDSFLKKINPFLHPNINATVNDTPNINF